MKIPTPTALCLAATLLTAIASSARAEQTNVATLAADVKKSLVFVEYTYRNENTSNAGTGQGIIMNKDGVVMISGSLIPEIFPKDYIKDIKIRLPLKNFTTVPATFLGRTQDRLFAFVKADSPIPGEPLDISKTGPADLGTPVVGVGLLSKAGGYEAYVGESRVKARVLMTNDLGATGSFGLTRVNSPVYDENTGGLVGITVPNGGETMQLTIPGKGSLPVSLNDEEQDSAFLVYDDIKQDLATIPTQPYESPRPWLGVDGLTGLDEDVKTLYSIDQPAGVTVGSVIPKQAADEAGIKDKDIVLAVNGKPFSQSSVPELMTMHFERALSKMKPGDTVTLGVLRDGKKLDVPVKLRTAPKLPSEVPHVFDAKLGATTRDLVFTDTYARKLPADQKGVMVALVKQGAPASIGATPLHVGDLITKINDQGVTDQKQFAGLLQAAEKDANTKELVFVVVHPDRSTSVCRIDLTPNAANTSGPDDGK